MKTVKRVFADSVPYFSADDFSSGLPRNPADKPEQLVIRTPNLARADAVGDILWGSDSHLIQGGALVVV